MKNFTLLAAFACFLMTVMSCTKEDDNCNSAPAIQRSGEQVLFAHDIQPMMRRSCSATNCHAAGPGTNEVSREFLSNAFASNSGMRIWLQGGGTTCGEINARDLALIKTWHEQGMH